MCHAAVNWVINTATYPDEVKPAARWLLVQIADRADKDEWSCYPSHKTLARDSGMSSRSVLSILDLLEKHGIIAREERRRPDGTRSTDMIIILQGAKVATPEVKPQLAIEQAAEVAAHNQGIEPGKSIVVSAPDPFEEWWAIYPRKVAKVMARKAWAQMTKQISLLTLEELMIKTRAFAAAVIHKDPEHIAHAATWLRGERWNDEITNRSQTDGKYARYPTDADRAAERTATRIDPMLEGARQALARPRRWKIGGPADSGQSDPQV